MFARVNNSALMLAVYLGHVYVWLGFEILTLGFSRVSGGPDEGRFSSGTK